MIAARLHAYHEPLKIDEVDEPKIKGPLDVIVRIGAAGLCRTDLHIQEGQWAEIQNPTLPYIPGHENAGWVHEVGAGVTNVEVGDTVIVHPLITCGLCRACRAGNDMHCENGAFPGLGRSTAASRSTCTRARAPWSSSTRRSSRRASRRWPTPASPPSTPSRRPFPCSGRARASWSSARAGSGTSASSACRALTAGGDHRHRPVRRRAGAGQGGGRAPHRQGRRLARGHRQGDHGRRRAPRRSSTSSARRARSRTASRCCATAASTT